MNRNSKKPFIIFEILVSYDHAKINWIGKGFLSHREVHWNKCSIWMVNRLVNATLHCDSLCRHEEVETSYSSILDNPYMACWKTVQSEGNLWPPTHPSHRVEQTLEAGWPSKWTMSSTKTITYYCYHHFRYRMDQLILKSKTTWGRLNSYRSLTSVISPRSGSTFASTTITTKSYGLVWHYFFENWRVRRSKLPFIVFREWVWPIIC